MLHDWSVDTNYKNYLENTKFYGFVIFISNSYQSKRKIGLKLNKTLHFVITEKRKRLEIFSIIFEETFKLYPMTRIYSDHKNEIKISEIIYHVHGC